MCDRSQLLHNTSHRILIITNYLKDSSKSCPATPIPTILINFILTDNKCELVERKRRRTNTNRYESGDKWVYEEAVKALEVENQYSMATNAKTLTINFPDQEISKSRIQEFSDAIVNIHVISPLTPRFCMVTLKDDSNVEEVIERINETPFGNGFLKARLKPANEVSFLTSNIKVFLTKCELEFSAGNKTRMY